MYQRESYSLSLSSSRERENRESDCQYPLIDTIASTFYYNTYGTAGAYGDVTVYVVKIGVLLFR